MRAWSRLLIWGCVGACCGMAALAMVGATNGFFNGFGSQAPTRPNVPPGLEAALLEAALGILYLWPWAPVFCFAAGCLVGFLKARFGKKRANARGLLGRPGN